MDQTSVVGWVINRGLEEGEIEARPRGRIRQQLYINGGKRERVQAYHGKYGGGGNRCIKYLNWY